LFTLRSRPKVVCTAISLVPVTKVCYIKLYTTDDSIFDLPIRRRSFPYQPHRFGCSYFAGQFPSRSVCRFFFFFWTDLCVIGSSSAVGTARRNPRRHGILKFSSAQPMKRLRSLLSILPIGFLEISACQVPNRQGRNIRYRPKNSHIL
jgi:hypothetical protein